MTSSICGPTSTRASSPSSFFIQGHTVCHHCDIALIKKRCTREPLVTNVSWVNLSVAFVPVKHCAAFNLRSFLHESVFILLLMEGHNVFLHFDIAQVKTRFTMGAACHDSFCGKSHGGMCLRYCHRSIWGPSSTRVSSPSSTSFHVRSFLKETVFILRFVEGHNVFLHFDIDQVKSRFTREPLVTTVSLLNLTVACVPEKHSAAFNLRSFLHESNFILLSIERHNVFIHFDIAQVKSRFTGESLVTNVS